jgi:hypothetical protein
MTWTHRELRLTKPQADFLTNRGQSSVHEKIQHRTELILSQRRMLKWNPQGDGTYKLVPSQKGLAAIDQFTRRA